MKIVKLTDGRIQFRDNSDNVYQSLDGCAVNAELKCNDEVVQIFAQGQYINIITADVVEYQIEPAAPVAGPFTSAQLLDILDTDFFLCNQSAYQGEPYGITRGISPMTTGNNTSIYPLLALKLQAAFLDSIVNILDFSILCTSSCQFNWYLYLNPTISGTTLTYSPWLDSSVEANTTSTSATTITGGRILKTGVASSANNGDMFQVIKIDPQFQLKADDVLVFAVQRIAGTSETFYAGANFTDQKQ
jgi:hypothetical protein